MQPAADQTAWKRFASLFLAVFAGGVALLYLFILLVDPYGDVPFSLPLHRAIMSISQRYMFPQIVRSGRYDSLIVGTSTSRLLDPILLDGPFQARFANLAMISASAWEQRMMVDYFRSRAQAPKVLVIGIDTVWCDPDADRNRITFRGFPDWLYDDNPWNDFGYLLNTGTLEIAVREVGYQLGLRPARVRDDGYEAFVPPESQYDAARASQNIWRGRSPPQSPAATPVALTDPQRRALSFPALAWLDAMLAELPDTLKILAYMPVHVAAQPWPGSEDAAIETECKARIAAIAQARGAKVIDWRIASSLTRDDANYWDRLHYRLPIADRIAGQLAAAVLSGEASNDGTYRITVR